MEAGVRWSSSMEGVGARSRAGRGQRSRLAAAAPVASSAAGLVALGWACAPALIAPAACRGTSQQVNSGFCLGLHHTSREPGVQMHLFGVLHPTRPKSAGRAEGPHVDARGRSTKEFGWMWKFDPKNRRKTKSPEEAEHILMATGRIPRPIRMANITNTPMQRTIIANAEERARLAQSIGVASFNKIQSKMILKRERDEVFDFDRIMVYGRLVCAFLDTDFDTGEPLTKGFPLKFKACFREDFDQFFPTEEQRWGQEMDRRGLREDYVVGAEVQKAVEETVQGDLTGSRLQPNYFEQCVLDNVLDLGELALQHVILNIDRRPIACDQKGLDKLKRRYKKRVKADLGVDIPITQGDDYTEIDYLYHTRDVQEIWDWTPEDSGIDWHSVTKRGLNPNRKLEM